MEGKRPLLSICIPNYNMGPWVATAIRSALMQPVAEVVVVDNASTDHSVLEMERFTDPRLAIHIRTDHVSMFENVNRAVSLTTGDWCLVLCADDELTASYHEQFAQGREQHPEAVVLSQAAIDPAGPVIIGDRSPVVYREPVAVLRSPTLPVSSTAFLRTAFDDLGGFAVDIGLAADWDFWMRVVMSVGPAVALGKTGALYNRSRGSWVRVESSAREVEAVRSWVDFRRGQWPPDLSEAMDQSLAERVERVGRELLARGDRSGLELLRTAATAGSKTAARRVWLETNPRTAKVYDLLRDGIRRGVRWLEKVMR